MTAATIARISLIGSAAIMGFAIYATAHLLISGAEPFQVGLTLACIGYLHYYLLKPAARRYKLAKWQSRRQAQKKGGQPCA